MKDRFLLHAREYAELLLHKAGQDEFTLAKLVPDPESPDEVIGFHAQQAVEKMLKSVLAARGIHFRKTHDLVELIDLIRENGIGFPAELEETRRLSPFAIQFRYDDWSAGAGSSLSRSWALDCVRRTRTWVESILQQPPDSSATHEGPRETPDE